MSGLLCLFVEEADGNEETLSTRTRANSSCTPLDTTESSRRSEESFLLCWCYSLGEWLWRCYCDEICRLLLPFGPPKRGLFLSFVHFVCEGYTQASNTEAVQLWRCCWFSFFFFSLELDTPVGALSTLVAMGWSIFSGQYEAPHRHIAQLFVQCSTSTKDDRCGSVRFDRMVIIRLKRRC